MAEPLRRSQISTATDPNETLGALLGPKFVEYRRAFALAEAGERPDHPLHLDVDVTTACNFRCPMCPAGATGHIFPGFTKGLFLDRKLYSQALTEGAGFGLPALRLGLTGEPLLVPDLAGWVAEARAAGLLDISLITNGRLLTPAVSRRLIEAGLTRLMISVDAAGPQAYARVRPGGDWAVLMGNINEFLRIRQSLGSVTPLLRISFVEMAHNQGDREPFERLFRPLADYLSFQRYLNILGAESTAFQVEAAADQAGPGQDFCPDPFTRLALQATGDLFPCCSDFGRLRPLGNLAASGLLAVWRSEEAVRLTRPEARENSPCRECLAASYYSGNKISRTRDFGKARNH